MTPEERFEALWMDYLEGELDEAGHAELRTLLPQNKPLQKSATDLFQIHRLLGFAATESAADSEAFVQATLARMPRSGEVFVQDVMKRVGKVRSAPSNKVIPFASASAQPENAERSWHRREWLAAAAALTVSAMGGAWWVQRRLRPLTFAQVTQSAGALLIHDGQVMAIDETLAHGRLTLVQGTLGLKYGRGVQLVIEAPAEFECRRADLLQLYAGRVAAEVPPPAKGFTVITSTGKAIDLGTKFGVDVPLHGEAEVHVFQGEVIAQSSGGGKRQSLRDGEAFSLQSGAGNTRELRSSAFIRPGEVASLQAALAAGQRAHSESALAALRDDPALIALLDFESDDLPTGSYRMVQGRWPGSHAPEFVNIGDHMKLDIGGNREWPQLTLAAWVRLDRLGEPYQSLIHTDGWSSNKSGQVHWMVTRKTTMRLALFGNTLAEGFEAREGYPDSRTAVLPEQGRWVHLATVYDSVARTVRFYLNGQFDNVVVQEIMHPARLGHAQVGNWDKQDRKLSGRIDEVLLLGRALGDDEVRGLFAAGNPYR